MRERSLATTIPELSTRGIKEALHGNSKRFLVKGRALRRIASKPEEVQKEIDELWRKIFFLDLELEIKEPQGKWDPIDLIIDKDEVIIEDIINKDPTYEIEVDENAMTIEVKDTEEMNPNDSAKSKLMDVVPIIEQILNFPEIEEVISEVTNEIPTDVQEPMKLMKET